MFLLVRDEESGGRILLDSASGTSSLDVIWLQKDLHFYVFAQTDRQTDTTVPTLMIFSYFDCHNLA